MSTVVPRRERIYCGLLLAGLAVICVLVLGNPWGGNASSETGRSAAAHPIPQGWSLVGRWEHYPNGRMYEKINGREVLFQQYGAVTLDFATVSHQGHDFDVYVYRMGDADGAFGIYLAQTPADARELELGTMADESGGQVRVLQGRTYLEIQPQEKSISTVLTTTLARGLLAGVKDENGTAGGAIDRLPKTGRVPGTLAFNKDNAFGFKSLGNTYSASYDEQGVTYDFLVRKVTPEQGAKVLEQVRDEITEFDGKVTQFTPTKLAAEILGKHLLLVREGDLLSGIYSERSDVEALYAKLKAKADGRK